MMNVVDFSQSDNDWIFWESQIITTAAGAQFPYVIKSSAAMALAM